MNFKLIKVVAVFLISTGLTQVSQAKLFDFLTKKKDATNSSQTPTPKEDSGVSEQQPHDSQDSNAAAASQVLPKDQDAQTAQKTPNPNAGMFYAEATRLDLSPKLPDLFKMVSNVLIAVDYPNKRVMLSFVIPPAGKDSPGGVVRVGWPYQEDTVEKKCGIRTIKAVAPEGSTPYHESFVITIADYQRNTCMDLKGLPKTQVTFDTFEVNYNEKTQSSIWAGELKPIPRDAENPWINRKKDEKPLNPNEGGGV